MSSSRSPGDAMDRTYPEADACHVACTSCFSHLHRVAAYLVPSSIQVRSAWKGSSKSLSVTPCWVLRCFLRGFVGRGFWLSPAGCLEDGTGEHREGIVLGFPWPRVAVEHGGSTRPGGSFLTPVSGRPALVEGSKFARAYQPRMHSSPLPTFSG